ncbi:MAG TPA: FHA domain-containing protein [Trebonia sp.]|jgi:ABC-type multidrug transport system ATPase subunit|nr:FHA domain-containing protein [Trebonia sp.]
MTAPDTAFPGGDPAIDLANGDPDSGPTAVQPLVVRGPGTTFTLTPGPVYRVGRAPDADVRVDQPGVSWRHASLLVFDGQWCLEDIGSTNGTFVGGQQVHRLSIGPDAADVQVRLGHPADGPLLSCSAASPPDSRQHQPDGQAPGTALWSSMAPGDRQPTGIIRIPDRVLRIGRAADNDVEIPDLRVSRYHAELRRVGGGQFELTDVGSHNGTYVGGQRVITATVTEADVIGIGGKTFQLVGDELREFDDADGVLLDVRGLTVTLPNGKLLLDHVSFPLPERCLLGVIGPSGAGKSTLLGAVTGTRPATSGTVGYDGRDLYANYAELRHRIGLVPQQNILHTQLSGRRALGYAAELRFPGDTSQAERERRVDEVLGELSLTQHADTRTAALSGGQQKRVNVALELLTKPSLLFLDEPTSGLDPGLDKSVMEMLSGLAADGRTVIVVTHSVANLASCDRLLVLVPGGRVAYFGTPADGLRHFGRGDWAEVFQDFEAQPGRDWAGEYRRSGYCSRYTTGPLQALSAAGNAPDSPAGRPSSGGTTAPGASVRHRDSAPPRPVNQLAQLSTLIRRYTAVIASDRNYVGVLALLPVILGALVRAIPDPHGLTGPSNGLAIQLLLILVMSACLIGVANAVRELVKERAIYTRERSAGLSPTAYLCSKLVVLGLISAAQSVLLVAIGLAGRPMPPHGVLTAALPEIMLGVAVLAIGSMTVGLLISAAVNSSDKTLPLLVVAVLLEVVLSGGVIRLNGMAGLQQLAWLTPSRWGFAAVASTIDLNNVTPPPPGDTPDPLWNHDLHVWAASMGVQVLLAAAFALLTLSLLRRSGGRRPGRERG